MRGEFFQHPARLFQIIADLRTAIDVRDGNDLGSFCPM
jgi:hypothetical protein